MIEAICRRAFFRYELPVHYAARPPLLDGDARKWARRYRLPALAEIEGTPLFADVFMAWNEEGLYAAFEVTGRRGPPQVDTVRWWEQDGFRLCIATREANDIKRATRYCHFFYLLPAGGGVGRRQPVVGLHRMSHAKEASAGVDVSEIRLAAHVARTWYSFEVAIPASCLTGWDPVDHARIGLFCKVNDIYSGSQTLTVDDELGWNVDPSTWATAVLMRT
jgi:hypothetical protein